jgi:phosphoribosylglycinamide formyltransferase-1
MKIIILASGNGTNAENLFKYANQRSELEVVALVTDNPEAGVLQRAENHNVASYVVPFFRDKFSTYKETKQDQENRLKQILQDLEFDWICLAGYMRILSKEFINQCFLPESNHTKIINIHPSMLPKFKGKDAYKDAYDAKVKSSGATVHFVSAEVDSGPILLQKSFPLYANDSLDDFRARGMEVEYEVYRQALDKLIKYTPIVTDKELLLDWREK